MPPMEKISIAVIVRNEEKILKYCLERITWADEIVIIDQSSKDNTRGIAKEYTDKIFITPTQGTCNADRMFAISRCTFDWVFFLDADERVTPELQQEIKKILKNPKEYTSFYLGRKNFFLGTWIKGGGWYPAYSIKLIKKGFAHFPSKVHCDGFPVGGKTGYLKEKTLHYTYDSIEQFFEKLDRFTTRSAEEAYHEGKRVNWDNFVYLSLAKPVFYFLRKYFLWLGLKDGMRGLFIAFSSSVTLFIHAVKIWELQQNVRNKRYL